VLLLGDSPFASARGIGPGTKVTALRRRLRGERALRVAGAVWYLADGANTRLVFRTRRSRVVAVGLADRRLTATPAAARRLLTSWRRSR
jgi:hypothetical protein